MIGNYTDTRAQTPMTRAYTECFIALQGQMLSIFIYLSFLTILNQLSTIMFFPLSVRLYIYCRNKFAVCVTEITPNVRLYFHYYQKFKKNPY